MDFLDDVMNPGDDYEFIGDSSCVAAAKFSKGDLSIQFQDGSTYTYHEVHPFVWYNLLRATSKGWFLNRYIRNNYSFTVG